MTSHASLYLRHSLWFAFATQASSPGMNYEGPHPGAFPSLGFQIHATRSAFAIRWGFIFWCMTMKYVRETFLMKYLNQIGHNEPNQKFEQVATCSVKGYKRAEQSLFSYGR